jgi:hypothetical protein
MKQVGSSVSFLLSLSLTLKMEATCSTLTATDFQRTIRRYIPEDRTLINMHCYRTSKNIENSIWNLVMTEQVSQPMACDGERLIKRYRSSHHVKFKCRPIYIRYEISFACIEQCQHDIEYKLMCSNNQQQNNSVKIS